MLQKQHTVVNLNFQDGTLFGNDAGEDELPDVLASYFVDQYAFHSFLDRTVRFSIARSRKGMGKSALLSKLNFDLDDIQEAHLTVRLTGMQIIDGSIPDFTNFLEAQSFWIKHICSKINAALGNKAGFAFSDTQMSLVEAAEISGLKERNLIGALISRIKTSKIPIEIIERDHSKNADSLLKRASESLEGAAVWVLIDDIDASYVDDERHKRLTASFFSACRFIAREMKDVYVRTTVRSDVWTNLRTIEDLDKCEQYMIDISWTKAELKQILSKKIYSWVERVQPAVARSLSFSYKNNCDEIIELAFERRFRWGEHRVPPFQPINILAAGRPRWMSQLCRLAGADAAKIGPAKKIAINQINSCMSKFTRYRVNDLYREHVHQFGRLERLIQTFAGGAVRYKTEELLSKINKGFVAGIGSGNIGLVDGEEYSTPLQLAHFLFRIGFLIARSGSTSDARSADFVTHEQNPELLRHANNPDSGYIWEIYPSYRQRVTFRGLGNSFAPDAD